MALIGAKIPLLTEGDLKGEDSRLLPVINLTRDIFYNCFDEITSGSADNKLFYRTCDSCFGKIGGSFNSSVSDSLSIELPKDIRFSCLLDAET